MGLLSHLPITWSHGHICESLPTSTHMALNFGNICALYSPFLHQLTMQSSLFELGRPVIFTCSTGDRVDATMKGPSKKGDQSAVLEYMKGGQMVTHPCAPLPRIEFRHLQVVSMCNCSAWCMIARRVSKPNICRLRILHCLCQRGCEPKIQGDFHVPKAFLCLHALGNVGGGQGALITCACARVCQ